MNDFSQDVFNEPGGIDQTIEFWKYAMKVNLCMICLEDNDEQNVEKDIVAANILLRFTKDGAGIPKYAQEPESLLRILYDVTERVDVCQHYGVDEYLGAAGLAVHMKYRSMGIAGEMLLARTPMCKELGFKVTETIFTSKASQIMAERAGFSTIKELKFSEIEEKLNVKFPKECESLMIMGKVIE